MPRGKKVKSVTGVTTPLPEDSTKAVADGTALTNSLTLIPVSTNAQPTTTTTGGSVHEGDVEPKQSKNPYVREIEKYVPSCWCFQAELLILSSFCLDVWPRLTRNEYVIH